MKNIEVREVIVSTLETRGEGVKHSPVRRLTRVFERDGTFIAEFDPTPETFVAKDLVDFARWMRDNVPKVAIGPNHVHRWMDSIERNENAE